MTTIFSFAILRTFSGTLSEYYSQISRLISHLFWRNKHFQRGVKKAIEKNIDVVLDLLLVLEVSHYFERSSFSIGKSVNFCHDKKDGNYVDPTRCDQYISCSNTLKYVMKCPKGLWYDARQDACDNPHNVKCNGKQLCFEWR